MTTFGRYQLLRRLGAGGMGEVFLARLSGAAGFEKRLVVKRIHRAWQRDPAFIDMFLDEARIAARLNHPNIAQIFELGEVEGVHFLAMEYVEGVSVAHLAATARERAKPVPLGAVCRIGADAAAALAHAHRALDPFGAPLHLVHRDVSPQNILVGFGGAVKLIDFGVAKAAGRLQESNPGAMRGKCAYASPEQVEGAVLDPRTDVFALGIVLWELCTGARLFRADNEAATLRKVAACEVPPPSSLAPGVPPGLDALCLKALSRLPQERFPDAGAMRDALEAITSSGLSAGTAELERYLRDLFASELEALAQPGADEDLGPEELQAFTPVTKPTRSPRSAESAARHHEETRSLTSPGASDTAIDTVPGLRPWRTRFIGRQADLERLAGLFADGQRLVTLVGPGGTGKTRLAAEFARAEAGRRGGGLWFCDLTEARTIDGICSAAAGVLGLPLAAPGELPGLVGLALAGQGRALVVLDNFEQVAAHGPATIGRWRELAPRTRFLVTSREPLRLAEEAVLELSPLALPATAAEVASSDAGRLFIDRAAAARSGYRLNEDDAAAVLNILGALDGIPLAIELAASRIRVMSAEQLCTRLARRFELLRSTQEGLGDRQATLRGAIDWSWELLDPAERAVLAQGSLFRGGFSLEAAEAVIVPGAGRPLLVDVLQSLRDKSLLRTCEPSRTSGRLRFGYDESVRAYAAEKLDESGQRASVEARHARYYLAEVMRLGEQVEGERGARALTQLALELDNAVAVHEHAMRTAPATAESLGLALRTLIALEPFVAIRGPVGFFGELLDRTLAKLEPALVEPALHARALVTAGASLRMRGQTEAAQAAFDRAVSLAGQVGAAAVETRAWAGLGIHLFHRGLLDEALAAARRALELARSSRDPLYEAQARSTEAIVLMRRGQLEEAEAGMQASLEILSRIHGRYGEGVVRDALGVLYAMRGQFAESREQLERALTLHRELGSRSAEASALKALAALAPELAHPEEGLAHARDALATARRFGVRQVVGSCLGELASILHQCGQLDEARGVYAEALDSLGQIGDHRLGAVYRGLAAALEAGCGRVDTARTLLEEAACLAAPTADPFVAAAIELDRLCLEAALAKQADEAGDGEKAAALRTSARRGIERAEAPGPADAQHPAGAPSPAESSALVRVALRLARRALGLSATGA